jgi:hypothetical protein
MLIKEWELLVIIPGGIALGYFGLYLVYLVNVSASNGSRATPGTGGLSMMET